MQLIDSKKKEEEIPNADFFETLDPFILKLLSNRNISKDTIDLFLKPNYGRDTHDPFLLKDMDRAVVRIWEALTKNERIIIYTDYDTDGIPAGVILHDFFKKIGYTNFENYIPHRNNEGYGLNKEAIKSFKEESHAQLIITADCGITDIEEVAYAQSLGIDVIVTDHHLPKRTREEPIRDDLPKAYAVINPQREDDAYPFSYLCGAGVAYKLVQALVQTNEEKGKPYPIQKGWEKWLLDMVGVATVCDMVPLQGENRVFAYYGLLVLQKSPRPGLQQLLKKIRVNQRFIAEEDIGFSIGPRINAASRIDIPHKAFELLSTSDEVRGGALARELNELNDKRKGLVASVVREIRLRLRNKELQEVIVLGNVNWHPGILGLAAHHLVLEHERPVFLWGEGGDGTLKGSCRSDGKVNIVHLMSEVPEVLSHFGGHEFSGGFSITRSKLHLLEDVLSEAYRGAKKGELKQKESYMLDGTLSISDVRFSTLSMINRLAPFGIGNPRPAFLFENVTVEAFKWFGKGEKHLLFDIVDEEKRRASVISFFARDSMFKDFEIKEGMTMSFLGSIERNFFRGASNIRIRMLELK